MQYFHTRRVRKRFGRVPFGTFSLNGRPHKICLLGFIFLRIHSNYCRVYTRESVLFIHIHVKCCTLSGF